MRKISMLLICVCAVTLCLVGCGAKVPSNEEYFAIVGLIDDGKYAEAEAQIDTRYGQFDYGEETVGTNKMNLYRLLYDKQGLYDQEMEVLLEYLAAYDFKDELENPPQPPFDTDEALSASNRILMWVSAAHSINEIMELVSPEKAQEAVDLVGEDILEKYGVDIYPWE